MPWRGPETPGEFPTLGYQVADLIEAKCAIPDGELMGQPFALTDEMLRFLLFHYRLDPETGRFVYGRGSQLIRPQKWGKGPFSSALVCAEADPEGPVRFAGWDAAGEPVGKPWASPWIQITAVSEDQTDNVWRALVPMIEMGGIAADIPDTGQTRINLPTGGRIEPVTSSARSRLGQRITFAIQDETHSWVKRNGGRTLADNQRRNLAGMGGRWVETTNAWDPSEESVAQHTFERDAKGGDVHVDDVDAGPGSVRNKSERRKMLRRVYGDSHWVDLDRVDSEVVALLDRDPGQAERFFLNRKRAAEDAAFDLRAWADGKTPFEVQDRSRIVIGVDGARFSDALAVVATDVLAGFQWPLGIWERPESAPDDYEHPFDEVDGVMLEAFETYDPWRVYVDPQWIDGLLQSWQGRWGDRRVLAWYTNRNRQIAWAVRKYTEAISAGDLTNDGDAVMAAHIANARRRRVNVYDDQHRQMHTIGKDRADSPRKMDAAMAGVLSWEARGDCIAAGEAEMVVAAPARARFL